MKKPRFIFIFLAFLILLILGLVLLSFGNKKVTLSPEIFGSTDMVLITPEEYEELISSQKSFLLFVDQDGCITAAGLKKLVSAVSESKNLHFYRIMFSDLRKTSLYDYVRYYPSAVIIDKGTPKSWLEADSDEDTTRYKDQTDFNNWLNTHINW